MKRFLLSGFFLFLFSPAYGHEPASELPVVETTELRRGQSYERCYMLEQDQVLEYSYESTKKMNFNIHYHQDEETMYLVNVRWKDTFDGMAVIPATTEICLMWENKAFGSPSVLGYQAKIIEGAEEAPPPAEE